MHVSKEVDYGLRAVIVIASNPDGHLTSKEISKRFQIPCNFLALILPKLVRAGLVVSIQGPKGGYKLAKTPREISFLQVVEALEGPLELIDCNQPKKCVLDSFCTMAGVWQDIKNDVAKRLSAVTLDQCVSEKYANAEACSGCLE